MQTEFLFANSRCKLKNGEKMTATEKSFEKKLQNLGFSNNFIFEKVMTSNLDLCKQLLEMLLDIKIERLELPQSEITFQDSIASKAVRFDVYVKDSNRVFDIEIQTTARSDFPKRARYYQSCIDVSNLRAGEGYRSLKTTYIIFLCTKDPFGKKLPIYTFKNSCVEDKNVKFEDDAAKIFYNAQEYDKMPTEDLRLFFKYLLENKSTSQFTQKLEQNVEKTKQTADEWRHYMTWEMEMIAERDIAYEEGVEKGKQAGIKEGISRGMEQGFERGKIETARKFLEMGISAEKIAEGTGLPLKTVLSLKNE